MSKEAEKILLTMPLVQAISIVQFRLYLPCNCPLESSSVGLLPFVSSSDETPKEKKKTDGKRKDGASEKETMVLYQLKKES